MSAPAVHHPCDACFAACETGCARAASAERHPEHELALIRDHAEPPSDSEAV